MARKKSRRPYFMDRKAADQMRRRKPKGRRRLGEITTDDIRAAAGRTIRSCVKHFKTKQYVSTCSTVVNKMTKELLHHPGDITHREIAIIANNADKKCAAYKDTDYGKICTRVVGKFIRQVAEIKPHLQGRRRQ